MAPPITIFFRLKKCLPGPKQTLSKKWPVSLKVHKINMFQQSQISFEGSPGHSNIPGNDQAYILA